MQRPSAIAPVTIAMCVTNFLGFFLTNWTPRPNHHPLNLFVLNAVMIVIGYVALWYLWNGSNWARWLVQLSSLLALWNLWTLRKPIPPQFRTVVHAPMTVVEALIAVFLLYYLNTRFVRNWFLRTTANPPPPALEQSARLQQEL